MKRGTIVILALVGFVLVFSAAYWGWIWFFRRPNHERVAYGMLVKIVKGQQKLHGQDLDGNRMRDYWTLDAAGLTQFGLLDRLTAQADAARAKDYEGISGPPVPNSGYFVIAMERDPFGGPYALTPRHNATSNPKHFGFCAYPAAYGPGTRNTYIVNESGRVWSKDTGGRAVRQFPADPLKEGWIRHD